MKWNTVFPCKLTLPYNSGDEDLHTYLLLISMLLKQYKNILWI